METNILHTHQELIEESKAGNHNAQYQLYQLYVDAMYNSSMRIVGIKEDAEDIIQDSFITAFKNLATFRYESTFGSWLKRIVINKSINHVKRKKNNSLALDTYSYQVSEDPTPITIPKPEIN